MVYSAPDNPGALLFTVPPSRSRTICVRRRIILVKMAYLLTESLKIVKIILDDERDAQNGIMICTKARFRVPFYRDLLLMCMIARFSQ